jgi:PAS domain S-box-containing protein
MDHQKSLQAKKIDRREFRRRSDIEKITADAASKETELRIAVEATGLGIFDYYPLTGELHWSHTVKNHFGLSPDAHVNYNVFLVGLHPEDRDRVERSLRDALQRHNGGRFDAEYRTVGIEDGKERWIAARGQAFFNDRGEAVRLIGTTLDVTEHKRADEELKQAVADLERANRELQKFKKGASPEPE